MALLESLLVEFRDLESVFEANEEFIRALKASIRKLLIASAAASDAVTDEELDQLISDLTFRVWATDINTAVLERLVSTGDLSILSNNKLRDVITKWIPYLEFIRINAQSDKEFVDHQLHPYLRKHISYIQIWNLQGARPGDQQLIWNFEPIELESKMSHRELLGSIEFQNLLVGRDEILDLILIGQNDAKGELNNMIGLVQHELGVSGSQ